MIFKPFFFPLTQKKLLKLASFLNSEKNECCFITSDMVFSIVGRVLSASLPYASEAIVASGS